MDEQIKTNLALDIAQLSLDKASLKARCDELEQELRQANERIIALEEKTGGE